MKAIRNMGGKSMNNQDRQLIVETLGEMRELKGEMREFRELDFTPLGAHY